jgi:acetyl esterase/lipase
LTKLHTDIIHYMDHNRTNNRSRLLIILILLVSSCAPKGPTFNETKFDIAERDVTYCTMTKLPQKMDIYYPSSGDPWPVLMYVHGGSWIEGDKAEGEGWKYLNEHGFLVISVNYRLGDYQTKFPTMIEDIKCAVRYLRAHSKEYNIDPERIAAVRASAGGHLVALLGTADESAGWDKGEYPEQSSKVQAVINISGIADFTSNIPSGLNTSIYNAFGKLANKDTLENIAASPISYVTSGDPTFLIIHGDRDGIVPVEQSKILHNKLIEAGVSSTLVIVEGGDHGLRNPKGGDTNPTSAEINQMIIGFLEETLK